MWELPRTQAETSRHHGLAKHRSCAPGHFQVSDCCSDAGSHRQPGFVSEVAEPGRSNLSGACGNPSLRK